MTFPPVAGAKYRQDFRYKTPEWQAQYGVLRNTIESFNGEVKDPAYESLGISGLRRLRGRTAQHFLTSLLVMAANIRKIRKFLIEHPDIDASPTPIERQRALRKYKLGRYRPVAHAPPAATGTE